MNNEHFDEDLDLGICCTGSSEEDDRFDYVVGRLEEALMSEEFSQLRHAFVSQFSGVFTDAEENQLVYMEVFTAYTRAIEDFIQHALSDVDLDEFSQQLLARPEEIDGPLAETLLSFSDFQVLKEMMVDANRPQSLCVNGELLFQLA